MGYETDVSTQLLRFPCSICGRPLRDPQSLERGWGPVCDQKYLGGAGSNRVMLRMEDLFDPEEAAAAIREAPNLKPDSWVEPIPNSIARVYKRGEELPDDGGKAQGGEIEVATRPLKVPGLRDYWESKGGKADDPKAVWRHDIETRRLMVSNGIWYASRAVTFGYREDIVTSEKVDPRWIVVAAVQRFARAVGLPAAAERMTNFYAVKVKKYIQAKAKLGKKALGKSGLVFEQVNPEQGIEVWNPERRRKEHRMAGVGLYRLHAPYNEQFNRLARENRDVFVAMEKDPPYFWRYFSERDLRTVINIVQPVYGDTPAVTRKQLSRADRLAIERHIQTSVMVADVETGEARWFSRADAAKLTAHARYQEVKL